MLPQASKPMLHRRAMVTDLNKDFERATAFGRASRVHRFISRPIRTLLYYAALKGRRTLPCSLPVQARTFFGEMLRVVLPEESACQLWYYGFIEEDVTWFLLTHLKEDMTFIDVGANVGYYTLLASRLVGPYGAIHAFEPAQRTFAILRHNTHRQTNITIQQKALWSDRTRMTFHEYGDHYSTLNSLRQHRLVRESRIPLHRSYDVECVSLDEYCRTYSVVPDFIKIDAEISEPQILRGSTHLISQHRPIIVLEVWDDESRRSREDILFLLAHNYTAYEYYAGKLVPHRLRDCYEYTNLLFVSSSAARSEAAAEVGGEPGEKP